MSEAPLVRGPRRRYDLCMSGLRIPLIRLILSLCVLMPAAAQMSTATSLPPLNLATLDGGSLSTADLQRTLIMVFVLPHCPACETVLGWVEEAAQAHPEIAFVLVTKADSTSLREMLGSLGAKVPVLLDTDDLLASVLSAYRPPMACSFYDGRLLSRLDWTFGSGEFSALVEELTAGAAAYWPVGVDGLTEQLAPELRAVDVNGAATSVENPSRPFLLVFIAATCPYCRAMLPELLDIAASFPVCLVVVGEEGEVPGLDEPLPPMLTLVRDKGDVIVEAYGIASTPTVVVVDGAGYVMWVHEGYMKGLACVAEAVAAPAQSSAGAP